MKYTIRKMLIFIKRHVLLLQTYYDEKREFPVKLQDMLTYKYELCMKKEHAFNVSIKCSNGLKAWEGWGEEQNEKSNRYETTNTWRWILYIEKVLKKQDMNYLTNILFHSFFVKFSVNLYIDIKILKRFVYLEEKKIKNTCWVIYHFIRRSQI